VAKKTPSFTSVIWTSVSSLPVASSTSFIRSCVSGRGGTTPCWAKAIAVASTAPIQIGRYRSPVTSRSSTIGWFDGISTRTPMTSTSRTYHTYSARVTPVGPLRIAVGVRLLPPEVACSRTDSAAISLTASSAAGFAAVSRPLLCGRDDLLDQADLAVGGRLEGAQVARLEAEVGQLARGPRDDQRVGVVVPVPPGGDQGVLLELVEQLLGDLGDLEQLLAREPHVVAARERRGAGQPVGGQRDLRHGGYDGLERRRLEAAVDGVEVLADHLQRQVVVSAACAARSAAVDVGVENLR
jgi:hypothetical protein